MMQFYPNNSQSIYLNANQPNNHITNIPQNITKSHQFFMPSIYAPKPMNTHINCASQQFSKQRNSVQQFGSYFCKNQQVSNAAYPFNSNLNNFDQYSEHSTSCGSDENNQDDFLESLAPISKSQSAQSGWIQKQSKQSSLQQQQYQQPQGVSEEAKYKTEMCKNWVETGKCNYAEKCKFAHGKNELVQKVAANKLFKTKPCKQFFEHATCSYGHRCHFLHDVRSLSEILQVNFYSKRLNNLTNEESADSHNLSSNSSPAQVSRLPIFQRISSIAAAETNQQPSLVSSL